MKINKIPKSPAWWLLLGPAFVWAATAQGSGELIWWPYLVARYGKAFLFLLIPAAFIQIFVNKEISKYTAITGKGIWTGFVSLGKWYVIPLFFLCLINFLWLGGYASAGGSSIYEVTRFPNGVSQQIGSLFWSYILIGLFSLGLLFSRSIYNFIEVIMKTVTVITVSGLLVSAIIVGTGSSFLEFIDGLFNPINLAIGVNWEGFDYAQLISGVVFAGMGGFLNLMYSYWMKDKGVGMAKYENKTSGLLIKEAGTEREMEVFEDNIENRKNFKSWMRYLTIDSTLAVTINALTIVLTSYLAFVLLWPERNYPQGWSITVSQASFFESSFGAIGRIVFLLVAAAFLVDTWVSVVDGVARQFADFSNNITKKVKSFKFWYSGWVIFLVVISLATLPLATPEFLLKTTGVISVFAFVFYIPALWYLNYVKLPNIYPKFVKSGRVSEGMLIISWIVYASLAIWYLVNIF